MISAALDSASWFRADDWNECGSADGSEMIEVTATCSPPICAATSPHTLVDAKI